MDSNEPIYAMRYVNGRWLAYAPVDYVRRGAPTWVVHPHPHHQVDRRGRRAGKRPFAIQTKARSVRGLALTLLGGTPKKNSTISTLLGLVGLLGLFTTNPSQGHPAQGRGAACSGRVVVLLPLTPLTGSRSVGLTATSCC